MSVRRIYAGKCDRCGPACRRPGESISGAGRLIYDRAHLVVVPASRIIVENNHRGAAPRRLLLEEVDQIHDERLFLQRVRVSGVAVLEGLRLQEALSGEVSRLNGTEEIVEI